MPETIDLSVGSYTTWITLVFDHPVPDDPFAGERWQNTVYTEISDTTLLLRHITHLCLNFPEVTHQFTLPQVDQGMWFLMSYDIELGMLLLDSDIPLAFRLECVHSMYHIYADFVSQSHVEVMENCFDMWWDSLCGQFWTGVRTRHSQPEAMTDEQQAKIIADASTLLETLDDCDGTTPGREFMESKGIMPSVQEEIAIDNLDVEERQMLDTMFETLCNILKLDDRRTQAYALHGLGHLQHPDVAAVVQNYIDTQGREWPEEAQSWLIECRDGTAM